MILKARVILFLGRNVPRKPRPSGRGQGVQYKGNYLTGKHPPLGRGASIIFDRIAFPLAESFFSSGQHPDPPRS
jgi:hypothetical protein